ncbi:hypothetical protein [Thermanaerothrix sp.]|jgi:hypothetical protein|uniref:hypothetical protein n=1 Tax=Thermanaerothrix sp. TaxID=2972675 RepID=UPI002ADDFFB9|nr:hypothetical protein [Thermanaerothrix sp.]
MNPRFILLGLILACLGLGLIVGEVRSDTQSWSLLSQWVSGGGTMTGSNLSLTFTAGESVNPVPLRGGNYILESGLPLEVACLRYSLFLPLVSR